MCQTEAQTRGHGSSLGSAVRSELQEIVDEVARVIGGPVTLEDRRFDLVAFCPHGTKIDQVRQQSILQRRSTPQVRLWFEQFGIATAEGAVRIPASDEHGSLARVCLPARWNGVTYGYLWLIDDGTVTDSTRARAIVLADRAGRLMAHQVRAREDVELLAQDLLLSSHAESVREAADRVDELGLIRRGMPIAVVELRQTILGRSWPGPMHLWPLPRTVLTYAGEDHAALLVPLPTGDLGPARELAARARDLCLERFDDPSGVDVVAGIGDVREDLTQARGSWQEARLAARVLAGVKELRPAAAWSDLGVYRLLGAGPEAAVAGAVLEPSVLRLVDHPDADLRETARVYLDLAGNVQITAARLNIHRQTVYHRLQRIENVTGLDLDSGRQRLLLHLGLTLAPLLSGAVHA